MKKLKKVSPVKFTLLKGSWVLSIICRSQDGEKVIITEEFFCGTDFDAEIKMMRIR